MRLVIMVEAFWARGLAANKQTLVMKRKDLLVMMTKRVGACLQTKRKQGLVRQVQIPGTLIGWEVAR